MPQKKDTSVKINNAIMHFELTFEIRRDKKRVKLRFCFSFPLPAFFVVASLDCAIHQGSNMDVVLDYADRQFFTPYVYPETWPEDDPYRQFINLMAITMTGAVIMYFTLGTASYYLIFDHQLKKHPQFLEVYFGHFRIII